MKSKLYCLLTSFYALMFSNTAFAQSKDCQSLTHGADIYKHFTGSIGKKKVVLNLRFGYCGGSNYRGSYYYELGSNDEKYLIISEPKRFAYDAELSATEFKIDDDWLNLGQDGNGPPRWNFTIANGKLTGKWHSADKKKTFDINLVEDYKKAYPLEITTYKDSLKKYVGITEASAHYQFIGVVPGVQIAKPDADFISEQFVQLADGVNKGVHAAQNLPRAEADASFDDFKKSLQQMISDTPATGFRFSQDCYSTLFPIYNDDGFVVAEYNSFVYRQNSFSIKHNYRCIDVTGKKVWNVDDVVADKNKLTRLLQEEYKSKLKPGSRAVLAVEHVMPGEKMILTHGGLAFCYPSGDKMHTTEEVRIFVPYEKLRGSLTKEFCARMNL